VVIFRGQKETASKHVWKTLIKTCS